MSIQLGEILHIQKGKKPLSQSDTATDGYLPYVDIKAFEQGIIDNYASTEKSLLCEDGDLLIVCDGSRSGLTGRAIKGVVGSTLAKISADGLTTEYLRYFIQSKYTLLNTQKKGTGTPHLNAEILKSSTIIVPSLPEQDRIVSRIEELFTELDKAVETLQTIKKQLAVYRQAVLKEALLKCEKTLSVKSVCVCVTDGDHQPPPKTKFGIPFIMITNIDKNAICWDNTSYVSEDYYNSLSEHRRPRNGDVLYTVTGSFGIPVLVDFDTKFCFQRHIALLRPNTRILQKFLFYVMQSPDVFIKARDKATGTAQKTVGLTPLREIQIPFTDSIENQNDIVVEIESRLSVCDSIEKTVGAALSKAEAMCQSILKKAFDGELK